MSTETEYDHQHGLLRHSLLLLIATQIGNVCNLLFQMLMMRSLSDVEYGILASMLSLILIMATPLEALRTAVAHQVALLLRLNRPSSVWPLLRMWAKYIGVAALIILLVGFPLSPALARFFHLPTAIPVVMTVIILAITLYLPYFAGGLQGAQSFRWMAAHGQVWAVIRYVAAVLLLLSFPHTAITGLTAHGISVAAGLVFGICAFHYAFLSMKSSSTYNFAGGRYFFMSLFVLAGFAVLMNADIALVKRFFSPEEAGTYAKAATISRSIIFLPGPIAMAMFPKVASSGMSTLADRGILFRAVLYTTGLIILSAAFCSLAAGPIWRIFTGTFPDAETRLLLRWIVWAMAPLGLTMLLVNFEIAQHRFKAPAMLVVLALIYVAAVARWHDSFAQVLTILTGVGLASLCIMIVDMRRATIAPESHAEPAGQSPITPT